ncbi:response regulator [Nocardioides sp. Soil774]|uniref:response regulator n=1 Tax=Nocardioides sp. Soil774 TaxID=1736408 RepID=UPI00138F1734|nr:response regulator transcription factor [Nocardioides sp. Soil774]
MRSAGLGAPVTVLVADDDAAFREALVDVLSADERFTVVGTAASGAEVPPMCARLRPDLVLVDVRMSGGGVDLARALRAQEGRRPLVVAVSAQTGVTTVAAMLSAGARGYLAKGRLGATLPDSLARVAAGERVLEVPGAEEALRLVEEPLAPGS